MLTEKEMLMPWPGAVRHVHTTRATEFMYQGQEASKSLTCMLACRYSQQGQMSPPFFVASFSKKKYNFLFFPSFFTPPLRHH